MNLARVEYYFSDILSSMETRKINDDEIITQKLLSRSQFGKDEKAYDKYGDVYIPQNLYIIGTVNMDETTFPFSKKLENRNFLLKGYQVLKLIYTIEFLLNNATVVTELCIKSKEEYRLWQELKRISSLTETKKEIGYSFRRFRDEVLILKEIYLMLIF